MAESFPEFGFDYPEGSEPDLMAAQMADFFTMDFFGVNEVSDEIRQRVLAERAGEPIESLQSEAFELALQPVETATHEISESEPTPAASGAADRLFTYLSNDFAKIDIDQNGKLDKKELGDSLATMTNRDEIQLLSWMSKNLNELEKLGDKDGGISMNDLAGLDTAINKGTGDLGFAFRNTDWLGRGTSSAIGGLGGAFVGAKVTSSAFSLKGALGYGAAVYGVLTAIDAIGYYMFDKPKIDAAITELQAMPERRAAS